MRTDAAKTAREAARTWVREGCEVPRTANELGVSESTVYDRLTLAKVNYGVRTLAQLAAVVARELTLEAEHTLGSAAQHRAA